MISILLPVYNAVNTLVDAVGSIRSQSFTDWELLLLDDGSTDGSGDIAAEFSQQDSRIKIFCLPHRGIVSALNVGLEHSKGKLIARMDADDISFPKRLEKQVHFLNLYPDIGVVSTQVEYGGDRRTQAGYAAYVDWQNGLLSPDDHYANRFVDAPLAHPTVMFRKDCVEEYGGYREGSFPEDFELWLRWMKNGVRFAKLPEPYLEWCDLPGRLSRRDPRYDPGEFYALKCEALKTCIPEDRPLWLWGAGRRTRQRFTPLEPFAGYIDVSPEKLGISSDGKPVVSPDHIPEDAFIVSGVASRGARENIERFLVGTGRQAVRDYYICA